MKPGAVVPTSLAAILALCVSWAMPSFAAEPKAPTPSKETREQMAAVHEKMAACLRSETAFADCRAQMQTQCRQTMGEQGCMMMGQGKGMGRQPPQQ